MQFCLCGYVSLAVSLLHWLVIHYQATLSDIQGVVRKRPFSSILVDQ